MPQRPDLRRHAEYLRRWLDIRNLHGLEIGPLDKPLVDRSSHSVRYVDQFETEELRAQCANKPQRDPAKVVQLDYVLKERTLPEVIDERFDYVIASHVVEHVPNLFGWLREVQSLLKQGGALFLVVPDRRFTFDVRRPPTTVGQFFENDFMLKTKPSVGAVFDARFYHRRVVPRKLWDGSLKVSELKPSFDPEQALAIANRAAEQYVNCHCNVFDPGSFREAIETSLELGLQPLSVQKLTQTERPFLDFLALLSA